MNVMLTHKQIEEVNAKGLYTTGEFARMFNVGKSVLIYYDRIGLFSPKEKDEKGYRLYSWKQFDEITLILLLRELGMSIEGIKEYISSRTPERFMSLLRNLSNDLENELARVLKLQNFINKRIKITDEALNSKTDTINIVDYPNEYFYVTLFEGNPYVIDDVYRTGASHNKLLKTLNINSPFSAGEITPRKSLSDGKIIHHMYFQTKLNSKNDYPDAWKRPAGKYLIIYQNVGYWKIPQYHKELKKYAANHNYVLGDWFYDEYLLDEFSANALESYFIKHSIQIIDGLE